MIVITSLLNSSLAPHSIHAEDDFAVLAYYYDGRIKLVDIESDETELEVFDTGLSDIEIIEFIFDGRYIAMESAYMYDKEGYCLEFLDLQEGEPAELENDYLPAGYSTNYQKEIAFIKYNESNDFDIAILNSSLEEVKTVGIPELIRSVIWLDGHWHMFDRRGSKQDGTPVYKLDFE